MLRIACLSIIGTACLSGCSETDPGSLPAAEAESLPGESQDANGASAAWTTLFDGTSLDGWNRLGDADWQLVEGAVRAEAGSGHLISAESYGDFELELEFWVTDDANSGVFIRCADPEQVDAASCYEINIFDQRPDQTYRTGSIVDLAAPQSVIDTGGRWNSFEIAARGTQLTVVLNGTTTVDVEDGRLSEGPFTLQYGAGTVMFRNIRIRRL